MWRCLLGRTAVCNMGAVLSAMVVSDEKCTGFGSGTVVGVTRRIPGILALNWALEVALVD